MEVKDKIKVSREFTDKPGGRDKLEGDFSGEEFLLKFLYPKFVRAIIQKHRLEVDLSNIYGYPSSFISGSFGNLSYRLGKELGDQVAVTLIKDHLSIISIDNPMRAKQTWLEIENPKTR